MVDTTPGAENDESQDQLMKRLLKTAKVIAVVGLSSRSNRPSNHVADYLQQQGYRIIPINPNETTVLGERCYPSLKGVPEHIDIVDIFRRSAHIPPIVDEAVTVKAGAVWMQLGLVNHEAEDIARAAGIPVVMNRCTLIEHSRLLKGKD